MSKRFAISIGFLLFFCVGVLVIFYLFVPGNSKFIVTNLDAEPVHVIAHWRDKTRDIGNIAPEKQVEFLVDDEAAMSFEITRQNGTGIKTSAMYFTLGEITNVEISHTGVEIKSNIGT